MSETQAPAPLPSGQRPATSGSSLIRILLVIMAILVFAGGCAVAALILWDANLRPSQPAGMPVALAVSAILLGALLAILALAAGAIVGQLERLGRAAPAAPEDPRPVLGRIEQVLRMINTTQSRAEATPASAGPNALAAANAAPLLEQIRDFTLMNETQRQRFATRHWQRRREVLSEIIERNVLVGDWNGAFGRLEELQLLMPEDATVQELKERVESEQNARLEEDLRGARTQARRFINASAWQQAEEVGAELQRKYFNKPGGAVLAEEVRREREAWERENMERLFRDIASATERRQWRPAVLAVEEFIRRYPADPRAEALRLDLPTLTENAAAQERREQEAQFKELLKNQRYNEAIGVARAVIQKYPHSPTATELNKLLPRVEELARQAQAATPASPATPASAPPQPAAPAGAPA